MHSNINVIIFDSMLITKARIGKIFRSQGFQVTDAESFHGIINAITKHDNDVNILIINTNQEIEENIFAMMREIKSGYPNVPVVILTSKAKKNFFLRCVSEGASDYILKPFEDYYLSERVLRLLKKDNKTIQKKKSNAFKNSITFNLKEYLNHEISKAKKGKYTVTILKTCLSASAYSENAEINADSSNRIFTGLKSLFWDTDIFIQYNLEHFLGYFPFCPEDNTVIIDDKVKKKFEELKIYDDNMKNYDISNTFVTFPSDGTDASTLIEKLFPEAEFE